MSYDMKNPLNKGIEDIPITFKRYEAVYLLELVRKYKKYTYPNIRLSTLKKLEDSIQPL